MLALRKAGAAALLCLGAWSCTTTEVRTAPAPANPQINDPIEPVNRAVYQFNDSIDRAVVGPLANGYERFTPRFMRSGVRNFVDNLATPMWFANEVFQGDWDDAGTAAGRFAINTTIGVGGLFDVATNSAGLEKQSEDLGQTLATYGVESGPYIVLPFAGPTTTRDATGAVGDFFLRPLTWVNFENRAEVRAGIGLAGAIDTRARVASALEQVRDGADPYANLRALYAQARETAIHEDADPYADLPAFE